MIDLVCRIQNCSVKEALDYLAQQESSFSFQQQELFEGEESQRIVIRIVRNITYPALEQYLRSRGIPIVTAKTFCKEVHYQCRGKRYFALGLVNKSGGWELRNKYFKGSTTPKDLSLFTHGHPSLAVVEGMFDLLSLVVIFPTIQATHDLLVLNSISLADKAAPVLGNYNTIDLYLDNDSGGKTLRAGELAEVVERLWDAMPGPRARAVVSGADVAAAALDALADRLAEGAAQTEDAAGRTGPDLAGRHQGMDDEDTDHGDVDHEGMDHGDMDMAPDGIPLAEGSEDDRDGLEMDALPVRLGPVLPHWPAGLVVDVALHGDLVAEARARLVDGGAGDEPEEPTPATDAARRCDEVAGVLALAGWEEGAVLARAARDDLLDHEGGDARALLVELRHRVEHSRLLRWSLGGVGEVTDGDADRLGLPEEVVGDCRDRMLRLVHRATAAAHAYAGTAGGVAPTPGVAPGVPVAALGSLIEGHDLYVARLVLATLGPPAHSTGGVRGA